MNAVSFIGHFDACVGHASTKRIGGKNYDNVNDFLRDVIPIDAKGDYAKEYAQGERYRHVGGNSDLLFKSLAEARSFFAQQ